MRRPMTLLVVQAFVLLFTAVSVASFVASVQFTSVYLQKGGETGSYALPLTWHYLYKVSVIGGLVTALVGSVGRRPWGRYALLVVLLFAASRLAIELVIGFPDTPSLGPVPGNYYLHSRTPTEALGETLMNAFILALLGYLGWRMAAGQDIRDYFTEAHAGQQREEADEVAQ